VPHNLIRAEVDTCAKARMVEIFFQGNRIAVHERRYGGLRHGTKAEHMPSAHPRYAEWTPERFHQWGAKVGPQTEGLPALTSPPPGANCARCRYSKSSAPSGH
jgi:hypothetical protein